MKLDKLDEMTKGWFVGNFEPSIIKTNDVEVGIKRFKAGDFEEKHYHKIATEITAIVSGIVRMNGKEYVEGDVITVYPNEETDFYSVTDSITTVVKYPGANNDRYINEE